MRVAVLAAMPSELRPFVRALGLRRAGDAYTGGLGDDEIVAMKMGVGMTGAARTAERVLGSGPIGRMVVIGIAGGVDRSLPIGTVVTPEVVVDGATGTEFHPTPWAPVRLAGRLATFDDFETEVGVMDQLQRDGFAAVDMETAAVAAVCEAHGCPYAVFRAISDNATDGSVDAAVAAMARPDGTPDVGAALRYMARRPWRIPAMMRLGRDSQRAAKAAADAAIRALRATPQS